MQTDRRCFLTRGLLGGAVLAVGGASLASWNGEARFKPTGPLEVLDTFAFSVAAAAAEAILAGVACDPVVMAHRMDQSLAYAAPEQQAEIRDLTRALNSPLLGLMLDGRPRPFLSLSVEGRAAALQSWGESRIVLRRSGYQALRKLAGAAYYSDPSTWAGIGYAGPPLTALKGVGR